jgi:hypothetical protein
MAENQQLIELGEKVWRHRKALRRYSKFLPALLTRRNCTEIF